MTPVVFSHDNLTTMSNPKSATHAIPPPPSALNRQAIERLRALSAAAGREPCSMLAVGATSPPPAKLVFSVRAHALDVLCSCTPCRAYRVLRVDAFCEGLIAGLAGAETAVEGPANTGAIDSPTLPPPGVLRAPAVTRELTPTRRPPSR